VDGPVPAPGIRAEGGASDRLAPDIDNPHAQDRARLRQPEFDGRGPLLDPDVLNPGSEAIGLDRDHGRATGRVLQGEFAPLVRRPGRRVGAKGVVAEDNPGSFYRPARAIDDPPSYRWPLGENHRTVEAAVRDATIRPIARMFNSHRDAAEVPR